MQLKPVRAVPLAIRSIPNVDTALAAKLNLPQHCRSVGLLTTTIDDVAYTALDEATKKAEVEVVYAKSMYAGSAHSSGPLSGEFLGIIAGKSPAEVSSGLKSATAFMQSEACFYSLNEDGSHAFYAHVVSRTGSYLSRVAGVTEGEPLAYLIAPPLEAIIGLDAAMKAAHVRLQVFFGPPTETNFGGGLLTGTQSACAAAAEAFSEAVQQVARLPHSG